MNKVYIDSNIFIRLLARDVPTQYKKAKKIFQDIEKGNLKGVVSILVINEIIWIAENYYKLNRAQYLRDLTKILSIRNLSCCELKKDFLIQILQGFAKTKVDFTDFYLSSICKKGEAVASFDKDFKKLGVKLA